MDKPNKATCMETLAVLVQAKGESVKAKEIKKRLKIYGYSIDTRTIAEHSKQLRELGYRVVSSKDGNNGGYFITDDRDDLIHQDRMLNSHIHELQRAREVVWDLINAYDNEYPTLPHER